MISKLVSRVLSRFTVWMTAGRRFITIGYLKIRYPSLSMEWDLQLGSRVRFKIFGSGRIVIGARSAIQDGAVIQADGGIVCLGQDVFIGFNSQIVALERVAIGADALIAPGCVIRDADHRFDEVGAAIRTQGHKVHPISIGRDVWLGANVVVTAGSSIGDGAVIGANAVVTKAIPSYSVAVGIPARVVRNRGSEVAPANLTVAVEAKSLR